MFFSRRNFGISLALLICLTKVSLAMERNDDLHDKRAKKTSMSSHEKLRLLRNISTRDTRVVSSFATEIKHGSSIIKKPAPLNYSQFNQDEGLLFSLARKLIITRSDLELINALLEDKTQLRKTDAHHHTIRTAMEMRLRKLAQEVIAQTPRTSDNYVLAKKLVELSLNDPMFMHEVVPYWPFIAGLHTTARLFELQHCDHNKLSRFTHDFVRFRLDPTLPSPKEALALYQRTASFLSESDRVRMLFYYFSRYTSSPRSDYGGMLSERARSAITKKSIVAHNPKDVAFAIYSIDREQFLAIKAKHIAIKYCRDFQTPKLSRFLKRIKDMRSYIANSIIKNEQPKKAAAFFKDVAKQLLLLGDFFGYTSVSAALHNPSIKSEIDDVDLSDLPDLTDKKTYLREKKKFKKHAIIPNIALLGGQLKNVFESLSQTPKTMFDISLNDTFPLAITTFLNDIETTQKALRNSPPRLGSRRGNTISDLIRLFKMLPQNEIEQRAVELRSLHAIDSKKSLILLPHEEVPTTDAAHWDPQAFHNWLKTQDLAGETDTIADQVYDGKSLLEVLALWRSSRNVKFSGSVHDALRNYEGWCKKNHVRPFSNLTRSRSFPSDLYSHLDRQFNWIMWLRNNGLADAIDIFTEHKIDSFKTFLEERARFLDVDDFYRELDIKGFMKKHLEHLVLLHARTNNQPAHIENWDMLDIESWLFEHNFSHFTYAIKEDNAFLADHFLAYFYVREVMHAKKFHEIGLNKTWTSPVFGTLLRDHSMMDAVKKRSVRKHPYQAPDSYLSWVLWLERHHLRDAITPLLKKKIRTFNQFLSTMDDFRERSKFFEHIGIDNDPKIKAHLLALIDFYDPMTGQKIPVVKWQLRHIEAFLYKHNMGHLIPNIIVDKSWDADRFLAAFYFYQRFNHRERKSLKLNPLWTNQVFSRMQKRHNLVRAMNQAVLENREDDFTDRKRGRLFFIFAMIRGNLIDSLPLFYEAGIDNFEKLDSDNLKKKQDDRGLHRLSKQLMKSL